MKFWYEIWQLNQSINQSCTYIHAAVNPKRGPVHHSFQQSPAFPLASGFTCHQMETSPNVMHGVQCCLAQHTRTINNQIRRESNHSSPSPEIPHGCRKHRKAWDSLESLAALVATKLEEGDFKGAVCLACSEDSVAGMNNSNLDVFKRKLHYIGPRPMTHRVSHHLGPACLRFNRPRLIPGFPSIPLPPIRTVFQACHKKWVWVTPLVTQVGRNAVLTGRWLAADPTRFQAASSHAGRWPLRIHTEEHSTERCIPSICDTAFPAVGRQCRSSTRRCMTVPKHPITTRTTSIR